MKVQSKSEELLQKCKECIDFPDNCGIYTHLALNHIKCKVFRPKNMIKYLYASVTFQEVPDEISLCISITNCPFKCPGCHSPELWDDQGIDLTYQELGKLIEKNKGISCVCFMGGDRNVKYIYYLCKYIRVNFPTLKICWYSGATHTNDCVIHSMEAFEYLDYIKEGPYIEELGGLTSPTTNQRFYKVDRKAQKLIDITSKFQKK